MDISFLHSKPPIVGHSYTFFKKGWRSPYRVGKDVDHLVGMATVNRVYGTTLICLISITFPGATKHPLQISLGAVFVVFDLGHSRYWEEPGHLA